ncbi:hypothetical protein RB601_003959 [Gaeumannomyces tritici]
MSHPRIEEVSDSDDAASDPSEGDIDEFDDADIIQRVDAHQKQQQQQQQPQKQAQQAQPPRPNPASSHAHAHPPQHGEMGIAHDPSAYAGFQCLYPIYFDAARTRAEGRRVSRSAAVDSPLAREIAQACGNLRLQVLFEPTKTHPRDWANPGRVRVLLLGPDGARPAGVKNKHHLYRLVSEHLRANPTTEGCAGLRAVAVPGLPTPAADAPWPRPAVPRGWKVGGLLPHYSPALTGGGVSENFLKDMMREMQGAGAGGGPGGLDMASMLAAATGGAGGGASGSGGGAGEEKKAKKKGKK